MSRDFDRAQEMVVASMEYIKVLGFRLRRTEVQRDDWKKVALFHADEVIKLRQRVDELKAERNAERERHKQTASVLAQYAPKTVDVPRAHPVKVGEYVKNDNGDVCQVREVYAEEYLLNTGWTWAFENCTPCDPPEASHDTPAGKEAAESAVEIKVGDVVEVVSALSVVTWSTDIGRRGKVTEIWKETLDLEEVPGYELPVGGVVEKRDVRKVIQ